jgi:hypothetical protein
MAKAPRPLSELSPAYRRRIERGLAKGKTRQGARGKKAGEHIIRKRKETALGGLPSSQRRAVEKFVRAQAERSAAIEKEAEIDALVINAIAWVTTNGFERYTEARKAQQARERAYARNQASSWANEDYNTWKHPGWDGDMAQMFDMAFHHDNRMFWYH